MTASTGKNGKIAFQSDRDGTQQVYRMRADGSRERRLTLAALLFSGAEGEWVKTAAPCRYSHPSIGSEARHVCRPSGVSFRRLHSPGPMGRVALHPTWNRELRSWLAYCVPFNQPKNHFKNLSCITFDHLVWLRSFADCSGLW